MDIVFALILVLLSGFFGYKIRDFVVFIGEKKKEAILEKETTAVKELEVMREKALVEMNFVKDEVKELATSMVDVVVEIQKNIRVVAERMDKTEEEDMDVIDIGKLNG